MAADRERDDRVFGPYYGTPPEERTTPEPPSDRSARLARRAQHHLRRAHRTVDRGFTP